MNYTIACIQANSLNLNHLNIFIEKQIIRNPFSLWIIAHICHLHLLCGDDFLAMCVVEGLTQGIACISANTKQFRQWKEHFSAMLLSPHVLSPAFIVLFLPTVLEAAGDFIFMS